MSASRAELQARALHVLTEGVEHLPLGPRLTIGHEVAEALAGFGECDRAIAAEDDVPVGLELDEEYRLGRNVTAATDWPLQGSRRALRVALPA